MKEEEEKEGRVIGVAQGQDNKMASRCGSPDKEQVQPRHVN